jgi:hypothetical protein
MKINVSVFFHSYGMHPTMLRWHSCGMPVWGEGGIFYRAIHPCGMSERDTLAKVESVRKILLLLPEQLLRAKVDRKKH